MKLLLIYYLLSQVLTSIYVSSCVYSNYYTVQCKSNKEMWFLNLFMISDIKVDILFEVFQLSKVFNAGTSNIIHVTHVC